MVAMAWQPEEIRKPERPKITGRRTSEKERSQDGWPSWAEIRGTLGLNGKQDWQPSAPHGAEGTMC